MATLWTNAEGHAFGTGGWLAPEDRDNEQQLQSAAFLSSLPGFDDANGYAEIDLPERALTVDLERKLTGAALGQIWQQTGSCVGAAAAKAYLNSVVGDIFHRGDNEEIKFCFPYATYGVGRQIAGMRGRGSGSFGSAQAKAVAQFGMLPVDHPAVPKPRIREGWFYWTEGEELSWSHPSAWPTPRSTLEATAQQYAIETVSRIRSTDEQARAAAQGYGITLASMFGTRDEQVINGVLIASWSGRWAHQMSCAGYLVHATHGRIWWIQNQWYATAHPRCPLMEPLGVTGGFWIKDATMQRIIESGEVFAHSNTKGFPRRAINWGTMGIA